MEIIPLYQCKHGYLYRISSRNLIAGVFNEKDGGFTGMREKFGHQYLFTEYHYDNGPPYGTVSPKHELEKCPFEPNESSKELYDWMIEKGYGLI